MCRWKEFWVNKKDDYIYFKILIEVKKITELQYVYITMDIAFLKLLIDNNNQQQ